jgi:hypothetical protein
VAETCRGDQAASSPSRTGGPKRGKLGSSGGADGGKKYGSGIGNSDVDEWSEPDNRFVGSTFDDLSSPQSRSGIFSSMFEERRSILLALPWRHRV